ncbi:MAG TPA: putative glycoside hydrolase [Virgibacillus sp.]|nr:putative glycoside hydrolase [Virgibacillus sp.]
MLGNQSKRRLFIWVIMIVLSCTACTKYEGSFMSHTAHITSYHQQKDHQTSRYKHRSDVRELAERRKGLKRFKRSETAEHNQMAMEKKSPPLRKDVKGIYLNKESMKKENIGTYIDLMNDTELNAVVMDVKDDFGKLTYDSDVEVAEDIQADEDRTVQDMKQLIERLKGEGIYTIARIVVFKDPYLAEQKSEWAIREKEGDIWEDGSGVKWIDPYKSDVWEYVTDVAKEVAAFGFDEIQYDYIRFPENAKEIDKIVTYDNPADRSKDENITRFLKYSNEKLKDIPVRTSADVFGLVTSSEDDMGIGQVWESVSKAVDYISPMTYPSHYGPGVYGIDSPNDDPYALVKHAMKDAVERNRKLGEDGATIRPWVQDFSMKKKYTEDEIKAQIKAMKDQGIEQYLVWNAKNDYTKDAYEK